MSLITLNLPWCNEFNKIYKAAYCNISTQKVQVIWHGQSGRKFEILLFDYKILKVNNHCYRYKI